MNSNIEGVGEVAKPSTLKEKISNYWYHYKWHSVAAIIAIIAILVCSLQFCSKESYDVHILYAGSKSIGRTVSNGTPAEIETVITSLKRVTKDYDGDGEKNIAFTNYIFYSADELQELGTDVNQSYVNEDKKSLESTLNFSEYYLCFISPAVYEEYNNVGGLDMFAPLPQYEGVEYYKSNAIYLSSLDFYKMPGISNLPSDTLVCIRTPNVLASKSEEHVKYVENANDMLNTVINFKIAD